eukprot:3457118-Rhodomonas_salina.1
MPVMTYPVSCLNNDSPNGRYHLVLMSHRRNLPLPASLRRRQPQQPDRPRQRTQHWPSDPCRPERRHPRRDRKPPPRHPGHGHQPQQQAHQVPDDAPPDYSRQPTPKARADPLAHCRLRTTT